MSTSRALGPGRPEHQHRPEDPSQFAREARQLLAAGLTVQDAASHLRLSPGYLRGLLSSPVGQEGSRAS
ncbi:MAG: hypothetical protein J0M16_00455 [Gammaproteobacteria bacterium]|nr:hypothetical protein [Gammaproteobacteria bacterium]